MRVCFILLLLPGLCWTAQHTELIVYEGGTVSLDCYYPAGNEEKLKYFCRVAGSSCDMLVHVAKPNTWTHEDRFALFDNRSSRIFTVHVAHLSSQDSGKYRCSINGSEPRSYNSTVWITVLGEQRRETTTQANVTGTRQGEGDSHFRFWSVVIMVCVGMLTIVCVFTIIHTFLFMNHYSGSASYHVRDESHSENSYVMMMKNTSVVHQENSPPEHHPQLPEPPDQNTAVAHLNNTDVHLYEISEATDTDYDYMDLSLQRQSNVYEHLLMDSQYESVYQTIDQTSK
ncbi:uncharacterized protein LOC143486096 isoform X4 [Brachyhypopomus gauderio]|uniref:uncharacterized protein LOC143486096 isoform X4 n=1 Tax=Brachyhypopomus gauderio TaxID=698409 RepID=UPI004042DD5A